MIKILHIVGDSKFGGGAVIITRLAGMARRQGWQVDVLTTDPAFQEALRQVGAEIVPLNVIWRNVRPLRDLGGLWRLYRFLRRSDYSLVHTHTSKAGLVGRVAAWMAGVPVIVHTVHGFAFHEASSRAAVRFYAALEKLAALCSDRITAVAGFHREWALQLGIAPARKIVAIPNGIREERAISTENPVEVRRRFGAGPEPLVLLSTGRLAPGKGIGDLLDVLPEVAHQCGRPVKLWLAGDGPLRAALEDRVAREGLTGLVTFLGFQKDVAPLLSACDMVVLPTMREGLSIALLEGMAAGKPIVTTNIGSNRETVREGEAALLVAPGDRDGLTRAIVRLATDPALRTRLALRARAIFLDDYTEERMLDRYRALYLRLLKDPAVWRARLSPWQLAVKRSLDVVVSGGALLALSPAIALIAAIVKLGSRGPAFFRQARLGRHGVPFTMWKFRTMVTGAPDLRNADGSTYNATDDPRVTRIGRFLRSTSLDELPQLINVFKGDMSLVGPRPDQPDQLRFYSPDERRKLSARPGLTGLAQLSGRNSIPWEERKRLDLEYVARQSLGLDFSILLKTIPYVLKRKDIYVQAAGSGARLSVRTER